MTEYVITEEQKKKIEEINHAFGVFGKYGLMECNEDDIFIFYIDDIKCSYCCGYTCALTNDGVVYIYDDK